MVTEEDFYLIDATPCFEKTHKAFFGASLIHEGINDNTFAYGFLREFFILRKELRINAVIVVISRDCFDVACESEIQHITNLLEELGVVVVNSRTMSAIDICNKYVHKAKAIYSENNAMLQFVCNACYIIRRKVGLDYEFYHSDMIYREYGVVPDKVPTLLALTNGKKDSFITRNQAVRLIESFGKLEDIFASHSQIPSAGLRTKLLDNKSVILKTYQKLIPIQVMEDGFVGADNGLFLNLDTERNAEHLKKMGLFSLTRLLKLSEGAAQKYGLVRSQSKNYEIIDNECALNNLINRLLKTETLAIDTESSSKDSHSANLFGIAFSNGEWNCYVPLLDQDLKGISATKALRKIKGVLEGKDKKYIGHNIKYDYVLLRRNGIQLKGLHFDTMLAAFECYGDLDFLNLGFLSEKLLGKRKTPYKEMLGKKDSPWDIPLSRLAEHACEDVEITFELYMMLQKEVASKSLTAQFYKHTLPLCGLLGDFEYRGVKVNEARLNRYSDSLLEKVSKLKRDINAVAGRELNVNAEKEVRDLLSAVLGIPFWQQSDKNFIAYLEILASSHEVPRRIIHYRRLLKDVQAIHAILNNVKNGLIYPVFSQVKSKAGFVTSAQPDIFGVAHSKEFLSCFESRVHPSLNDPISAIKRLQTMSSDPVLKKDISNSHGVNTFLITHPFLNGIDSNSLLLSLVTGISDNKITHQLLIDRTKLAALRQEIESRYKKLFIYLDNFKKDSLEQGFSKAEGERKYLAGLRSPNIEKRRKALEFAIAWLIGYSNSALSGTAM